jgi:hypothetical protein
MPWAPSDIAQSFWLRFWREPDGEGTEQWRGTVWHEQQASDEKPIAVASPQEAFNLVRRRLHISIGVNDSMHLLADRPQEKKLNRIRPGRFQSSQLLLALWRRIRGT